MKKITTLLFLLFVLNFFAVQVASASGAECLNLGVNLRQGSRDSSSVKNVYNLQEFLRSKNYLKANSTGYFGVQTLKAVKDLQRDNEIIPTGFVGPLTRAMIQEISCPVKAPDVVTETPVNAPNIPTPEPVVENIPTTPPVTVSDAVLEAPNSSSLRVKTDGAVSITNDSLRVRGTVTAGARSATESWFELTTNPSVYKVSESIVSPKASQKTNTKFEYSFTGLKPVTTYYYRACAGNVSLGQKSCGGTTSSTTTNI